MYSIRGSRFAEEEYRQNPRLRQVERDVEFKANAYATPQLAPSTYTSVYGSTFALRAQAMARIVSNRFLLLNFQNFI